MALILNGNPLHSSTRREAIGLHLFKTIPSQHVKRRPSLQQQFNRTGGKFSCHFSGGSNREEQARKALESALGGKKSEFEKWNEEIKRREEAGGGGHSGSGGGGWFGWGGRFGWSNGDNFWPEAQQTILAILGIILTYLIVTKGNVMLAVISNALLFALRATRNGLTLSSGIFRRRSGDAPKKEVFVRVSAKESVLRKWGAD